MRQTYRMVKVAVFTLLAISLSFCTAGYPEGGISNDVMRTARGYVYAGEASKLEKLLRDEGSRLRPGDLSSLLFDARHEAVILILKGEGADLNTTDQDLRTLLMVAAQDENLGLVKFYLKQGLLVNQKDRFGRTALYFAAGNESNEVIKFLLEAGAYIDSQTNTGVTPLMMAAAEGSIAPFETLKQKGAATYLLDHAERDVCNYVEQPRAYKSKEEKQRMIKLLAKPN